MGSGTTATPGVGYGYIEPATHDDFAVWIVAENRKRRRIERLYAEQLRFWLGKEPLHLWSRDVGTESQRHLLSYIFQGNRVQYPNGFLASGRRR